MKTVENIRMWSVCYVLITFGSGWEDAQSNVAFKSKPELKMSKINSPIYNPQAFQVHNTK